MASCVFSCSPTHPPTDLNPSHRHQSIHLARVGLPTNSHLHHQSDSDRKHPIVHVHLTRCREWQTGDSLIPIIPPVSPRLSSRPLASRRRTRCCRSECTRCWSTWRTTRTRGRLWIRWRRTSLRAIIPLFGGELTSRTITLTNWMGMSILGHQFARDYNDVNLQADGSAEDGGETGQRGVFALFGFP